MFPTADIEDISQVTSLNTSASFPSDAKHSTANTQVAKQNNREITLKMLLKEMIFCAALALTTYGALHNTPSKVSKHPEAVRFFSENSAVTDFYTGDLGLALTVMNKIEMTFVMYYAPWDAESQFVRKEFERAALYLEPWIFFAGINCWNPGSECRLRHHRIPSWPVLMLYTSNSRGILYKGPKDAASMIRFLEVMMKPLERVSRIEDLVNLLSYCDAVAIGFTPLADTSKYYNIWYNVAQKTREFDVIGEICFAAVTSKELASELGAPTVPSARLMLWNDTKDYKAENDLQSWNESALMTWILENFTQPVARIIPMWKKAFSFERFVDGNPLLILFTPLNPILNQIPHYGLMREIAMEYYNCNRNGTNQWISELIKLQQAQRVLYQQKDFAKFCSEYRMKEPIAKPNRYFKKETVSRNNKYPWSNTTKKNQNSDVFDFLLKRGLSIPKTAGSIDQESKFLSLLLLHECNMRVLPAEKSFYDTYEHCESFENVEPEHESELSSETSETSILPFENDHLCAENLQQEHVLHFCDLMRLKRDWDTPAVPSELDDVNVTHIEGLSCANNVSLNMIAIDSVRNHHFAEALGIDVFKKKDKTAVIILDSKHESQYVMSEEYNAKSVRDFILNFTYKRLKRSLRTHVVDAAHTHYYGSSGAVRPQSDNNTVYITDLTTKTFRRFVREPGVISVVAVCGGRCDAGVSGAVWRGAASLARCGLRAHAARIDALAHDLPWHYTPPNYPAVLVFFAPKGGGEADSRAYPGGVRVTAAGVAALALRLVGTPTHLHARLALCAHATAVSEKRSCLKDLKNYVTSIIGKNLNYWRRADMKELKDALLKRLQLLHRISFDLSLLHTSDLNHPNLLQDSISNSLSSLNENWDIDVTILRKNVTISVGS